MIQLHSTETARGEVDVTLDWATGVVSYRKAGVVQSVVDATGRNLSPFVSQAVQGLTQSGVRRVLVLGHGGGAASRLLHKQGLDVVSVDCDACAESLGRLFFRAPPNLPVVVAEAADYLASASPASFDGVLIDFQDAAATPPDYLSPAFWTSVVTALRPPAVIITHVTSDLFSGPDWPAIRNALAEAGLGSTALSDAFPAGDRMLISSSSSV